MAEQDNETQYRMEMVFDRWCGRLLTTPRDVVRLHQAIQFAWPHVPKRSDFCDLVWLQLLKLTCEDFYEWVRNYLQNVGSYRDRGRPGDSEAVDQGKQLLELLKRFGWHEPIYLSGIDDMLPGLKSSILANENGAFKVFEFENGELEQFEQSRRLGSPSHWTGYFAFALPSYAIKDEELSALRDAFRTNPAEAARIIREVLDRPHDRVGHFVDVLLDRLSDAPEGRSEEESAGLLQAFAEVMDDVERTTRWTFKEGRNEIWEETRFLLRKCHPTNFLSVIKTGASISWLAHILRDQGFALGKPKGHRSNPENAWVQSDTFDEAVQILVGRFEALEMKTIFALPSPMDVLFCWVQLGNSEDVKARFQEATKTHTDFLTALNAMRGWSNSSDKGVYHPLPAAYVAQFTDPQAAHDRLNFLASRGKPKHKPLAESLLAQWHPLEPQSSVIPV
jgi:hypothetical protein